MDEAKKCVDELDVDRNKIFFLQNQFFNKNFDFRATWLCILIFVIVNV